MGHVSLESLATGRGALQNLDTFTAYYLFRYAHEPSNRISSFHNRQDRKKKIRKKQKKKNNKDCVIYRNPAYW